MNTMHAVVVDPTAPGRLAIREVDRPTPLPHEALVRVKAVSLNRGEVRRAQTAAAGWRPGWDLAGIIEVAATDGSGFPAGTRVVGFVPSGGWGEYVPVPADSLAALPPSVDFKDAATLPVAGLTALLALERGGLLLGKSVLITGASGGVGHFACQLACHAGANVTAQVRSPELVEFVKNTGAQQIVVGSDQEPLAQHGPYDLILDSVGGETLSAILETLAPDGECVLFGTTAGAEVTFNASHFYGKGGLKLYGFILFHELKKQPASAGLTQLVNLLIQGLLVPHIDREASWTEISDVAQQLTQRQFLGKAVLWVSD